ncbi:alpha/beta fold hydrolase [Tsukamurella sp. M9C]|uniref:alpha/beta fold hydrolase n=1 Tax=Tsukamurella sp. M9C TaxID=2877520 RepID=UPI001CCC699B|nr:alpha/beta fold hydrolase [Tsukamurella sp. M9C]MCA0158130.1 alpha/beta fold hydrolase [Tsukamurella sp. M9C]
MTERITEFTRSGLTFPVVDSGPIDGEIVALLHGFPQTPTSWAATAEHLHEQGYRTVVPWQRGYARTASPARRWQYRSSELAADAAALLERTGPAHLVGHDWGSSTAWLTAATYPHLVRTLTAVSVPHPFAFLRAFLRSDQALKSYYMYLFQIPAVPELLARRFPGRFEAFLRGSGMPDDAIRTVVDEVLTPGLLGGGLNYYRGMPFTTVKPGQNTRITCPVTYIWSTDDVALTRAGAELAGEYVDGPYRFVVLDGVSHWIPDERPEELAAEIVGTAALA